MASWTTKGSGPPENDPRGSAGVAYEAKLSCGHVQRVPSYARVGEAATCNNGDSMQRISEIRTARTARVKR